MKTTAFYAIKVTKFPNGDPEPNGDYLTPVTTTWLSGKTIYTSHPNQGRAMIFKTREFAEEFLAKEREKGFTTNLVSVVKIMVTNCLPIKYGT